MWSTCYYIRNILQICVTSLLRLVVCLIVLVTSHLSRFFLKSTQRATRVNLLHSAISSRSSTTYAHNARARERRHTRIASNKTRRKWVDEHKSGTIGSVGRCPCGLGSGQWTPWPCETRAALVLHTVSHAVPLPPPPMPRRALLFPLFHSAPRTFSLPPSRTAPILHICNVHSWAFHSP